MDMTPHFDPALMREFSHEDLTALGDPLFTAYAVAHGMWVPYLKDDIFACWVQTERCRFFRDEFGINPPVLSKGGDGHWHSRPWADIADRTAAQFETWVMGQYPLPAPPPPGMGRV